MEKTELADYDLSKICRLCLKSNVRLYNIYLFSSKLNAQVADAIIKCTSVQINKFDKLPNYICKACYVQLVNTHQFQIQSMESDKKLRHYLLKLRDKNIELGYCVTVFENCKNLASVRGDKMNNSTSVERNSFNLLSSTEENLSVNEDNYSSQETEIDRIDLPIKYEAEEISNSDTTVFCEDTKIGLTDTIVDWADSKSGLLESTNELSDSKPQIISTINNGHKQTNSNENIIVKCDPFEQIYVKQEKEECDTASVTAFINDNSESCQNNGDTLSVSKKQSRYKYTRERSYQCDVCNKYFTQIGHLRDHKRLHTGEKPYQCDICCKSFNQLGHLNTHKLSHTGERPYQCDVCNKNFSQSCHLNRHKLTHTGEKPYQCDICSKCFNQSSSLKNHKRLHTGVKAHRCDVCGKTFNQLDHLNVHKLSHTRERPY